MKWWSVDIRCRPYKGGSNSTFFCYMIYLYNMDLKQIIRRVLLEDSYQNEVLEYNQDIHMEHELKDLMNYIRVFLRRVSKYDEKIIFNNRENIMGTIMEYIYVYMNSDKDFEYEIDIDSQNEVEIGIPEFDTNARKGLLNKLKSLFSKYLKNGDEDNQRTELNRKRIISDLNDFIGAYLNFSKDEKINESTFYVDEDGSVQKTKIKPSNFLNEAEYQGRKVQLGKIMQGDVKKFKVYVKNDKGNVVKVNFGFGGKSAKGKRMVIKKNNPERRRSFRARHNCENPGPRWKPRYWACRTW